MTLKIGKKDYEVNDAVADLLDGEGVKCLDGESKTNDKGDEIFVTYIRTLKKSDSNFEKIFIEMYDTVAGEMLLKDGVDVEGVNPSLEGEEEEGGGGEEEKVEMLKKLAEGGQGSRN